MGLLRLSRVAFAPMPVQLAAAVAVIGSFVLAFAVYVHRSGGIATGPEPVVTLQPEPNVSAAPARADVRVRVETLDNAPVADNPVELQSRFETGEPPKRISGRTDASGRVTFHDVEVDPGSPWIAVAPYAGVDFASGLLRSGRSATIRVAPVTESAGRVSVDVASLALVGDLRGLQALQVVSVRNRSHLAFDGGVRLPIVLNGTQVDPGPELDREALLLNKQGEMVSIAPLLQGTQQFTYSYAAAMERRGRPFRLTVPYPAKRFDVLLGSSLDVKPSGSLHRHGSVKLGGRSYRRYTAEHLRAGDVLSGRLVLATSGRTMRIALVVLAALIALAIFLVPLLRRRKRPAPELEPTPEVQPEWT